MKQVAFIEVPDGVRTTFSLAVGNRPVEAELIFVIDTGVLLGKIPTTGDLSGIRFTYDTSTGVVTTGYAPLSGARLYAYVQSNAAMGMRRYDLSGTKNNSNKTFTAPANVPAGSQALLIQGGRALESVGASEAGLQYRQVSTGSGTTTFALGTAPFDSNEQVYCFIEEAEANGAQFAKVSVAGTRDGNNRLFLIGAAADSVYSPELLVIQAGAAILRTNSRTPTAGFCAYYDPTQQLIVGSAPAANDDLNVWVTQNIPRTDVDPVFEAWFLDQRQDRTFYASFTGKKTDESTKTFDVATRTYITLPTETPANRVLTPFLRGGATIERSAQELFFGRSAPTLGEVEMPNSYNAAIGAYRFDADFGVGGYNVDGQPVTLKMGGPNLPFANWATVLTGRCGEIRAQAGRIAIAIQNEEGFLRRKKTTHGQLRSSEYPNLPPGLDGAYKPIVLGKVSNYFPQPLSTATPLYLLAGHSINRVLAVRDKGVLLVEGTDYSVQPSAVGGATLTLVSPPQGDVSVDFEGRLSGAGQYLSIVGAVIEELLIQELGFSQADFEGFLLSLFQLEAPFLVGLAVSSPTSVLEVVDQLLVGIPCFYGFTRVGRFYVHLLKPPTGAPVAQLSDARLLAAPKLRFAPPEHYQWTVQYQRMENVQGASALAPTVSTADRALYGTEYRTKTASDSLILNTYPYATDKLIETRLTEPAHAQTLADLHKSLYGIRRALVDCEVTLQSLSVGLGSVLGASFSRYNIGTGSSLWRVLRIRESLGNSRGPSESAEYTLWQ